MDFVAEIQAMTTSDGAPRYTNMEDVIAVAKRKTYEQFGGRRQQRPIDDATVPLAKKFLDKLNGDA